jgi:hypothetical protein
LKAEELIGSSDTQKLTEDMQTIPIFFPGGLSLTAGRQGQPGREHSNASATGLR